MLSARWLGIAYPVFLLVKNLMHGDYRYGNLVELSSMLLGCFIAYLSVRAGTGARKINRVAGEK